MLLEVKRRLRHLGQRARKNLGQHFLIDEVVLNDIVTAAALSPADTVLEIGPGLGVLTRELAAQAGRVVAVELDDSLAAALKKEMAPCGNVTVVNESILKLDPASLVGERSGYKVVANLPYNITAAALRHFLEASRPPALIVVMVQKEVAQAIAAAPGKLSLLAVSVQFYGRPQIIGYVPASAFYPAPEVDSAILKIELNRKPPEAAPDRDGFFRLVRAGFSAPRKQLAGSLANGLELPKERAAALLAEAAIDAKRRAETLSIQEWVGLWRVYRERQPLC
jgi:16S rRNA (adenine1518-N6/adenine1519-N6)-dimethyltransferase